MKSEKFYVLQIHGREKADYEKVRMYEGLYPLIYFQLIWKVMKMPSKFSERVKLYLPFVLE